MRWNPHVTVAVLLERDGRFLFVEELIDGRLVLNQPAGHVEDGESLLDAAVRETLEETGWHVRPEALIGVYRWRSPRDGETFFRFCFSAAALGHDAERDLDTGIVRALWLSAEEFAQQAERHRSPLVSRGVEDYLKGSRYPLDVIKDIAGV